MTEEVLDMDLYLNTPFRDMLTLCVAVFLSIILLAIASWVSMSGTAGNTFDMVLGEVIIFHSGADMVCLSRMESKKSPCLN